MLNDGIYKYYAIDHDDGSQIHKGTVKIENQSVQIGFDPMGVLKNMFGPNPTIQKAEDIFRSVNRNGYALFKKSSKDQSEKPEKETPKKQGSLPPGVKSVYEVLGKTEDLQKGAMKKLAPFNPDKDVPAEHQDMTESWTRENSTDPKKQVEGWERRANIPKMNPNAKVRALHKLGRKTLVRKHPTTGERLFLLHRGMSSDEHQANHKDGASTYPPGSTTSWTPSLDVAEGFSSDYRKPGIPGKVASAWVPESEIHSIPNQVLRPNEDTQFRTENEVVVNHSTPHFHANPTVVKQDQRPILTLDGKLKVNESRWQNKLSPQRAALLRPKSNALISNKMKKHEEPLVLSKSDLSNKIKTGIAGMAIAAAGAVGPMTQEPPMDAPGPVAQASRSMDQKPKSNLNVKKERILSSISDVESQGGLRTDHQATSKEGIHQGAKAYGNYGLMPMIIKETIKAHPDLTQKHGDAMQLSGADLHNYMGKHPDLEHEIASRHYDRLSKHFGENPQKIAMAWINGIQGTKKAIKKGVDLDQHWHVIKVKNAYQKRKQSGK